MLEDSGGSINEGLVEKVAISSIIVVGNYARSLYRFRGQLMKSLVLKGHRVIGCAPKIDGWTQNALQALGVEWHSIPMKRGLAFFLLDLWTVVALYRLCRKYRPAIILNYTIKPVIYGSIAAWLARVPCRACIITGLGSTFNKTNLVAAALRYIIRTMYRMALRSVHVVIFQNNDDRELFCKEGILSNNKRAIVVHGSGVDLTEYAFSNLPNRPKFLLVARLIEEKGIKEFCNASARLKKRYPSAQFKIVGWIDKDNPKGLSQSQVEEMIAQSGVEYSGWLADVRSAIADSSVFVLPSYYGEGVPRTILEAMAMGRPIITTDAPGCRETVRNRINGFLVPVRDDIALEMAMEHFLRNPELAVEMGRLSRRLAEEKFDVHTVNSKIIASLLMT